MLCRRRKSRARWWELLVPVLIVVIGLAAPPRPLDHGIYALAGVLICAAAAWFALVLWRRCGFVEFLERFFQ